MSGEGAEPTRRGKHKAGEAQRAAGLNNLKKAHEKNRARKAAKKAAPPEKPRWQKLIDGEIKVRDLTTKELVRHACANNDGTWIGARAQLPQRIITAMDVENHRRERRLLDRLTKPAIKALRERIDDGDNPAQQLGAAKFAIEYRFGKPVEVVHVGAETEFDRLSQSGFAIQRGADLAKELEAHMEPEDEGEGGDTDVVDAELVEEEA